jgi:hypothetical protein
MPHAVHNSVKTRGDFHGCPHDVRQIRMTWADCALRLNDSIKRFDVWGPRLQLLLLRIVSTPTKLWIRFMGENSL